MSESLKDGTGEGFFARVDAKNRAHNGVISRTESNAAVDDGRLFLFSTLTVTLTNALITPMMYIKNEDDRDLFLDTFLITTGTSTGGTGSYTLSTHAAIDVSSTIVTEAKPMIAANAKLSSSNTFNGDSFLGESGDTLVGGFNVTAFLAAPGEPITFNNQTAFPKGVSGLFAVTPPPGNTSMDVSLILVAYYLDGELPN